MSFSIMNACLALSPTGVPELADGPMSNARRFAWEPLGLRVARCAARQMGVLLAEWLNYRANQAARVGSGYLFSVQKL